VTPSELKYAVEQAGHDSHFFDRDTLKFFGDTMKNYGVRAATVRSDYNPQGEYVKGGAEFKAWELYRKRATSKGCTESAYFAADTFRRVFPTKEAR
jgi:hypothetical protein